MERIYVANLPQDIRIKDIDDFFRPFGKLIAVDVKNTNPACALVEFDNPRSAFNAVQATNGFNCEGYRIQVKLVSANEVRNNNGNFNDNWDNRNNSGGNNNNYQGNNQFPNSQRFGNNDGMGIGVGGGRISGGSLNTPNVQYPTNSRVNVGRINDTNFSQTPSVPAGYTGDPYSYGLSGSGIKWFERFIQEGYSKDQARERALERRTQPFLRSYQGPNDQNMSGFNSSMGGNGSNYGGNNYSGGFDMPMSNRSMPGGGGRSFGNEASNNFGGGFNNNQPPMSNFPSGNNAGFSNRMSSNGMLRNQSSFNGGRAFGNGVPMKRPAILDQFASGLNKRVRVQEGPIQRNIRAKDSGLLTGILTKQNPPNRFLKAMGLYRLAVRILEKIADNNAKGTPHPNDVRDKVQQTAIIKDFVILFGDQEKAKLLINSLAERLNKVLKRGPAKGKATPAAVKNTKPATASDEAKKEEEYLEQIRKPITEKRVERYALDCAAIKKLQAKSELNEVDQAALRNHQKFKEIFERDMKEIEQKVEEYRKSKNKGVYHHEITAYRYSHYKSSLAVIKDMEARKTLSVKAKETLTKHKLFMQEFEFDLKHMQHKLKADSPKRYEQDLFKILQTLKENEKKLRDETICISRRHVQTDKVKDTKEWYLRLSRYRSYGKFIQECELKDPASLTDKLKATLKKHREYIEKYEKEMKVLDKKFKYLEAEEKEKAEKAKAEGETAKEEQQNGEEEAAAAAVVAEEETVEELAEGAEETGEGEGEEVYNNDEQLENNGEAQDAE